MSLQRTFIDAGVLIAAARGKGEIARKAMEVLDDPDREFASSTFLKLEVMPKAVYNNHEEEVEFYRSFFDNDVFIWAESVEEVIEKAHQQAIEFGLGAMDSLHVGAAISIKALEIVTTEKPNKPIHRIKAVKVTSI